MRGVLRRAWEPVSDAWFSLRLLVRYGLSPARVAVSVLALVPVLLVVVRLVVAGSSVPGGAVSVAVVASTAAASPADAADLSASGSASASGPASVRGPVLLVGDSLVAGEEGIYREAFDSVGVDVVLDAAVSRGLRSGWVCPPGPASEVGAAEDAGEDAGGNEVSSGGVVSARRPGCARQGLDVVGRYARAGTLPEVVVVALGTNDAGMPGSGVRARLDDLRAILGPRRLFLLETVSSPMTDDRVGWNAVARSWCAADAGCRFVDWFVGPGEGFFSADGVHLSALGSRSRASALVAAVVG